MADIEGATADVDEVEKEAPEKSMDDTLRETLQAIRDRGEGEAIVGQEPARDESGKFAAKPPVVGQVTTPAPKPGEQTPVAAAPVEQPAQVDPAPQSWKKDVAEKWATLPPEVRSEVARREADFHRGIEQYKQAAQFATTMQQVLAPHMQTIQSLGVTPDVAVRELLQTEHRLRYGSPEQKQQAFIKLAGDYGVDVAGLANVEAPKFDPNIQALQNQLQQVQGWMQKQSQEVQQREEQTLNSEIARFAADPTHSHFEQVKGHMAALLQAQQAKDLQDAYEQAIYANPTTRALVLAEQQAKERAEAAQKAQAAKATASVNTRNRPAMPISQPIGSMEQTIKDTYRRLTA